MLFYICTKLRSSVFSWLYFRMWNITLHVVLITAVLVSKILYLVFLCCAGLNRTEGNLALWITYSILLRKKHWSIGTLRVSLLTQCTEFLWQLKARAGGRFSHCLNTGLPPPPPPPPTQPNQNSWEEALVLNPDNFYVLLLACLYCCGEGEIRWLPYSSFSYESLMYPHMNIHWFMHMAR